MVNSVIGRIPQARAKNLGWRQTTDGGWRTSARNRTTQQNRTQFGTTTMASDESIAAEVVAASLGGAISTSLLYPLEVLKTKMQAETKTNSTTQTQTQAKDGKDTVDIDNDNDEVGTTADGGAEDLMGGEDGYSGIDIDMDKDVNANEDQDENNHVPTKDRSNLTMVEYAKDLHAQHGTQVFFQGVQTSAFQSATEKALYFFAYTGLKGIYRGISGSQSLSTMSSLVLGCLAEWAHLPVTLPLDCWNTAIQTDTTGRGPMELLMAMLSDKVRCFPCFRMNGCSAFVSQPDHRRCFASWTPSVLFRVLPALTSLDFPPIRSNLIRCDAIRCDAIRFCSSTNASNVL